MADRIADELGIRNLVARYADCIARNDTDGWAETWAEDGEWEVLGQVSRSREGVTERLRELLGGLEFVAQIASGGVIEFEGEGATGRWTITEHGVFKGGRPFFTLGLYKDEYVQSGTTWLFSRRVFHGIYIGSPDLSGNFNPPPAGF